MRILLAASEVHPFAKTGGLGDVAGALPRALDALGLDVAVVLPLYRTVRRRDDRLRVVAESVSCRFAGMDRPFRLFEAELPGSSSIPVYLIENPWLFEEEEGIYGAEPGSYGDGHLRFLYFSRAILKVPRPSGFVPDVFHLNDWQTGLVAPLLRTTHRHDELIGQAATVLTIHNLAYQGVFPVEELRYAGIPEFLLCEGRLIEKGLANLLAGGIRFADAISTVSQSYAREILTPEYGAGLEALLDWRRDLLVGIVNGLDTETWNPETDPHLPRHFRADALEGKDECRRVLLEKTGLEPTDGPIFGIVSRLVAQKGLALVPPAFERILADDSSIRLVALGTGEPELEGELYGLAMRHPGQVSVSLAFDAPLSSLIEAGADLFLMPSLFEPCGLNQLISMRYGTPPIVRRIGGLRDTVIDASEAAIREGRATGFTFDELSADALEHAMRRAIGLFHSPDLFHRVKLAGMRADWSWSRSAREYVALYEAAKRRQRDGSHLRELLAGLPEGPLESEPPHVPASPKTDSSDSFVMVPVSPTLLFCQWEFATGRSAAGLDALDGAEGSDIVQELVLYEIGGVREHRFRLDSARRSLHAPVVPGRRYRGELLLRIPGKAPIRVLEHEDVAVPAVEAHA